MAVPKLDMARIHARGFTPVQARRGRLVHVTSLHTASQTACGLTCQNYRLVLGVVTCMRCKAIVLRPVRLRRR